jgi:cobalt-zinc-cadmium efflux system outer membrane protein
MLAILGLSGAVGAAPTAPGSDAGTTPGALRPAAPAAVSGPQVALDRGRGALLGPEKNALSVEEAVQEAIERNLVLLAERYKVPIAQADQVTARLRLNPVLSFGADHLDVLGTRYDDTNRAGPQEFFARTDIFFLGGRKRVRRIAVADNAVTVAELELRDAIRRLILDVQLTCTAVQLADAEADLAQQNLELFQGLVKLNEIRVARGDLAKVELTRAQVAEMQASFDLRQSIARRQVAQNNLGLLLGRTSTGREIQVLGRMREDKDPVVLNEIRGEALRMRPDYRALRAEQIRSSHDIRRQMAEGKIDASIGVEVRRQQGLAGTGNSMGIFAAVPIPMFNRNQGGVERARQENLAVQARLKAAEQGIRVELENAFIAYQTARDLLESFETGLLLKAEQVLGTATYAYKRGDASLIELLDAQRAFNETRRRYNEARAAYANALYTIDAVTARKVPP